MFWKFGVEWESVEVAQVDEQGRRISCWPPILVERGGPSCASHRRVALFWSLESF
jgi:hypothetical protein